VTDLARSSSVVAPLLLGCELTVGDRRGTIVETEAYGGADDAASHAFRGMTKRNAVMFGRAGLLYVYFTYGMHWCANVVTGDEGDGQAVLIRALVPQWPDAPRCDGPARLCKALGIDGGVNGVDLLDGASPVQLAFRPPLAAREPTPRIGISKEVDRPWRFVAAHDVRERAGERTPLSPTASTGRAAAGRRVARRVSPDA
jgi:DNA-3-methyladenine glycosylase